MFLEEYHYGPDYANEWLCSIPVLTPIQNTTAWQPHPRTYRTVLDACVRQWGQIITRNLRGETEKYTGVGGSTQLDLINITTSSNRVMGYVYIMHSYR